MTRSSFRKRPLGMMLALLLSMLLVSQNVLPTVAYARQADVAMQNHTSLSTQNKTVSGLRVDDVEKPQAGNELDNTAQVTAAEGDTWEIPVLWIGDNMQLSTVAEEGRSYLPTLAFFVPEGLALDGDTITVALSDSLTELFGGQEIISVYDASTGITFILPASLRNFFARSSQTAAVDEPLSESEVAPVSNAAAPVAESTPVTDTELVADPDEIVEDDEDDGEGIGAADSLVNIFCAQTARNALSDEDLEWLINLILDKLEPQAVELLLNSFPAFRAAADKGEVGEEIGLYIYYQKGDDDGIPGHQTLANAVAYVAADVIKLDGSLKYAYLLAVDINSLIQKDAQRKPVTNTTTGKYTLLRDGNDMRTFENTIVHELFHAIMDDYNRTGMAGGTVMEEVYTPDDKFASLALQQKYNTIRYPSWFIEGTASSVENVYQFRYWTFQILRKLEGNKGTGTGDLNASFTPSLVINNYVNGKYNDGGDVYFALPYSNMARDAEGNTVDTDASRYVTGYLATLYLSTLAAEQYLNLKPAKTVNNVLTFDSAAMRSGLNTILERMHNGATLDSVIAEISPKNQGVPVYKDTNTFADLFVRGRLEGDTYTNDPNSLMFVTDFLNYMVYIDSILPKDIAANGSILQAFDKEYRSPLDPSKDSSSSNLKIVNTSEMTASTVKPDTIDIGGGRTAVNTVNAAADTAAADTGDGQPADTTLPSAAKSEAGENGASDDANGVADDTSAETNGEAADVANAETTSNAAGDVSAEAAGSGTEVTEQPEAGGQTEQAPAASEVAPTAVDTPAEPAAAPVAEPVANSEPKPECTTTA